MSGGSAALHEGPETSTVFLNDWKIQGIAHRDCMVGCSSLEMICSCELRPAWLQFIHHAQHHLSKDDGHPANVISELKHLFA